MSVKCQKQTLNTELRCSSDDDGAEGPRLVAAAIDRDVGITSEIDGVSDNLRATRTRAGSAGITDSTSRNIDSSAKVLGRSAIEFKRGPRRNLAITKYDDSGCGASDRGRQIHGRIAIDCCCGPIVTGTRCKDERYALPINRSASVHRKATLVDIINARIQS